MTRDEFVTRWTARKSELERLGALVDGAKFCSEVLGDFDALTTSEDERLLALQEASSISGYSTHHLRKLARNGKLPVEKRGRRLYFRVKDLPRKATVFDAQPARAYDPVADARQVATRSS